jgi:lipoprotein-anchoring transpeptidase ErfK/SrfK
MADEDDEDGDDIVEMGPGGIQSQPLPPPGAPNALMAPGQAMPPVAAVPGADPRYSSVPPTGTPIELTAPARPLPPVASAPAPAAAPAARPAPSIFSSLPGLRPPAEVEETTGAVPAAVAPGAPAATGTIAGLPPEDQPEIGAPKELPPHLRRQIVEYWTKEPVGTLIVDTPNTYLYLVLGEGKAMRYGIGVGRDGFTWAGVEKVTKLAEWPDWHPPAEMIERQPYLPRFMAGGESNPMGARALYLGKTVYRIHGTNQPSTIGSFVSSGCIRLVNADVEDLYQRVKVGTRVVVLPGNPPATAANRAPASPITAPSATAANRAPASPITAPATASNPLPQTR